MDAVFWQWTLVVGSSLILFLISPWAKNKEQFFNAVYHKRTPNTLVLMGSLVISWIFAKSITNAANLGLEFGLVGGLAYAAYYLSFAVAGILLYRIRKYGNYTSIHHFLGSRFGRGAVAVFSLLISIRLFNEIWSNTMVIGSYFGEYGSWPYYLSILVFTFLTLAYALKGGLSGSIFTDTVQMVLFSLLLMVVLWNIWTADASFSATTAIQSGTWSFDTGLNLLFAALLQSFSYPFHDPVLTDRGFLSTPKITLRAFLWASLVGGICIVLYSVIGIYAHHQGMVGQAAVVVGRSFGMVTLLVVNFIMITSAASTLDSTFSSFSKLLAVDLNWGNRISFGRAAMIAVAVLGTLPVFMDATILSATTISGTMVIGLTPVFLLWKGSASPLSFHLSVFGGLFFGLLLVLDVFPEFLILTSGHYAELLWVNFWGIFCCFLLYLMPQWMKK
ncbi:MAG: sodium:solute symporter [Bacteroidota bacterium]